MAAASASEGPDLRYRFEQFKNQQPRSTERAMEDLPKLAQRLGFTDGIPYTAFLQSFIDLIVHVHQNIEWYDKKIRTEMWWRRLYITITLGLLLLLPAVVYWLNKDSANWTASSAAILTSLFAFYRGLSAWLDQRKVIAGRAKAAAALRELLYDLEQRWKNVRFDSTIAGIFDKALEEAISKARAIVAQETQSYFETLAYPTFNLGSVFSTSATEATSAVGTIAAESIAAAKERRTAELAAKIAAAKVAQLRSQVDQINQDIAAARSRGDRTTADSLMATLGTAMEDLRAAEIDRTV